MSIVITRGLFVNKLERKCVKCVREAVEDVKNEPRSKAGRIIKYSRKLLNTDEARWYRR